MARNNTHWIQTKFSYFSYCRPASGLWNAWAECDESRALLS